ncbi:hypothetical protein B0T20DRAFT_178559 [Sordaria brevicollis]|uniref:Uncharacterized protein n=1 Tax=Sordaria brevicollis TaxID=83679 RepID=A0AAE0PII3_SORBR|nr:hypothetical protein B0T20DRAFT_178559 [Sordaria brevicollis]
MATVPTTGSFRQRDRTSHRYVRSLEDEVVPKPLQIVKRSLSQSTTSRSFCQPPAASRNCSDESFSSDGSMGSIPESPRANMPLSVPKMRENKALEYTSASMVNLLAGQRQYERVNDASAFRPNYHSRISDITSDSLRTNSSASLQIQRSRLSPSPFNITRSPNFLIRRARQLVSDHKDYPNERERCGNKRDAILNAYGEASMPHTPTPTPRKVHNLWREGGQSSSRLRTSKSMYHLYNHDGDDESIASYDGEGHHSMLEARELSQRGSSTAWHPVPFDQVAEEPSMLVPRVIVTPEIKALDNGATTL